MPAYIVRFGALGPVKIGWSADVARRVEQLGSRLWDDVHLLRTLAGDGATEQALHRRFASLRIRWEWFHYHPDMMGDLGFEDVPLIRPLPSLDARFTNHNIRSACSDALRNWMLNQGLSAANVASLVGSTPNTVEGWIAYGWPPRKKTRNKLIEAGATELITVYAAHDAYNKRSRERGVAA